MRERKAGSYDSTAITIPLTNQGRDNRESRATSCRAALPRGERREAWTLTR